MGYHTEAGVSQHLAVALDHLAVHTARQDIGVAIAVDDGHRQTGLIHNKRQRLGHLRIGTPRGVRVDIRQALVESNGHGHAAVSAAQLNGKQCADLLPGVFLQDIQGLGKHLLGRIGRINGHAVALLLGNDLICFGCDRAHQENRRIGVIILQIVKAGYLEGLPLLQHLCQGYDAGLRVTAATAAEEAAASGKILNILLCL